MPAAPQILQAHLRMPAGASSEAAADASPEARRRRLYGGRLRITASSEAFCTSRLRTREYAAMRPTAHCSIEGYTYIYIKYETETVFLRS